MVNLCLLLYILNFPLSYSVPIASKRVSQRGVAGNEANEKEKDGTAQVSMYNFNSSPAVVLPALPGIIPVQELRKQENEPEKKNMTLHEETKLKNQSSELLNDKSETQLYKPVVGSGDTKVDLEKENVNANNYVNENSNTSDVPFCKLCICPESKRYSIEKCQSCPPCPSLITEPIDLANNTQYTDNSNNYKRTNSSVIETSVKEEAVNTDDITHNTQEINKNDENTIAVGHSHDKMRYILKDAIIMLTTPVLLFLSVIIYRKGKHLCQRRHYLRSTYLIDGMYTENNPLCVSDVMLLNDR